MSENRQQRVKRTERIIQSLKKTYPDAKCSLNYSSPHELLVATILSAQCTDHRVNQVSKSLFKKYKDPQSFANVEIEELAQDIHSCGYHNQKAKNIQGASFIIVEKYDGIVPSTMEELIQLPGVGRKTANCILGEIYGIPSMVIDTHMMRIMNLMGFTKSRDAKKIELELMEIFHKKDWIKLTHMIIDHGRAICIARRPQCSVCVLTSFCPSANS